MDVQIMNIPSIETERLRLRPFFPTDFEPFAEMLADPQVVAFLGDGKARDRTEAWFSFAAMVGHWHLRGYGAFAVEEKATGKFLGRIGFLNPEGWPGIEISYVLGRWAWGKGYASEGGKAAMDYGFSEFGFSRLISLIHPDNRASIRVAESLGESFEREIDFKGKRLFVYGRDRPY
jgi:RimJ/RimL family protein N-acetyltransferase